MHGDRDRMKKGRQTIHIALLRQKTTEYCHRPTAIIVNRTYSVQKEIVFLILLCIFIAPNVWCSTIYI